MKIFSEVGNLSGGDYFTHAFGNWSGCDLGSYV